ncbi:hypothetical protein [Vibrio campbellii]|uniref:Uncharacterized protein n=1 Tax=Vibrio campbellii (strain ATCC BAA-1116) TaxID=2902295 RepID=A7MV54_VIBC1|nr:hypothetical protein [Vibrio campbellii]ABU70438.1 hypothetical protein VIBHAR_01468 [Vibrio campbellii ATCC BAA-1116]AGU96421.1 hypothetical protein M892_05725 [Vibrio campbellii ATCC BAA-1116]MBT0124578.1 hypothetical protein [Vibrio campbellii]MBT0139503.1 hypothetical protein [Vibrio campbellii]MBT0144165.1 hypothetical protein [Vibrio campbellii]
MTLKTFLTAILLSISANAFPSDLTVSIPNEITDVSTYWMDGEGTQRLIRYNSEFSPCFIIESFKNGTFSEPTRRESICNAKIGDTILNLRDNLSGSMWFDNFSWEDNILNFELFTSVATYTCFLRYPLSNSVVPQCQ